MRIHVWTCNRCHDDGGACEMVDRIPRSNYDSILNTIHVLVEAGRVRVKEIRKAPKTSKPTRVWEVIE